MFYTIDKDLTQPNPLCLIISKKETKYMFFVFKHWMQKNVGNIFKKLLILQTNYVQSCLKSGILSSL